MKNAILTAGLMLTSLSQTGCGSVAKHSRPKAQVTNKHILRELNHEIINRCDVSNLSTSYEIDDKKPDPRDPFHRNYIIIDQAQIQIPIAEINNCVRNLIRGVHMQRVTQENDQLEFTLGENSELNKDLLSIYSDLELYNLSDKIECTTTDFSGYFVKGFVCNEFNANPLQKSEISRVIQRHGYITNQSENQIIATKNNN